jgi:hypothetical protein
MLISEFSEEYIFDFELMRAKYTSFVEKIKELENQK